MVGAARPDFCTESPPMATDIDRLDAAVDAAVREHTTTPRSIEAGRWAITCDGIPITAISGREAGEILDVLGWPVLADEAPDDSPDDVPDDAGSEFADEGPRLADIAKLTAWGLGAIAALWLVTCLFLFCG